MHSWWRALVITMSSVVVAASGWAACGNRVRTVGGTGPIHASDVSDAGMARSGDGAPPEDVRRALHLAVEFQVIDADADPPQTAVDLVMTDETGASDRASVGEFSGTCTDVSEKHKLGPMKPLLAVDCLYQQQSVQLRFVPRLGHLIILRARVDIGSGEEPAFDEHRRVPLPAGVPLVTGE